jgi:glycosyltransferase involved in cell wall biosynthesis
VISVVTITYNNYEELVKTLASISGKSDLESIVVNGGSCEKTAEFLKAYSGIVISEKDKGISDAFNKGARNARGDAIAFLNSGDVLIESDYYARVAKAFKENPSSSYVYGNLLFDDHLAGKMVFRSEEAKLSTIGKGMPFPHPTLVVKASVFKEVGEFNLDYRIGMDYDWVIRLLLKKHTGTHLICTPVLMDGMGVSSQNQEKSILECKRALVEHNLFSGQIERDWKFRMAKLKIKNVIQKTFGDRVLKVLKRVKNR